MENKEYLCENCEEVTKDFFEVRIQGTRRTFFYCEDCRDKGLENNSCVEVE